MERLDCSEAAIDSDCARAAASAEVVVEDDDVVDEEEPPWPRTPAADNFLADLAASLLLEVDRDSPSELLARTGFCNCCTASGLTMIRMEER